MPKYQVDFEYNLPEFGTMEGIIAPTPFDAEEKAIREIEASYPEAVDIIVTATTEVED